jgi:hypothetical protein
MKRIPTILFVLCAAFLIMLTPATAQETTPAPVLDGPAYGSGLVARAAVGAAFLPGGSTVLAPNLYVEMPFTVLGGNLGVLATAYRVADVTATSVEVTGTYQPEFGGERLDPYGFLSVGMGISGASGFVYGGEGGVRYWLTPRLGLNAYVGYVGAVSTEYPKAGIGLAVSL